MMQFELILPTPPSVNQLWRMGKGNWYSTAVYKNYTKEVQLRVAVSKQESFSEDQRLALSVDYYQHDRRRRDLDNIFKALGDSLQAAGVYHDDSQIDQLSIKRFMGSKNDYILVKICDIMSQV